MHSTRKELIMKLSELEALCHEHTVDEEDQLTELVPFKGLVVMFATQLEGQGMVKLTADSITKSPNGITFNDGMGVEDSYELDDELAITVYRPLHPMELGHCGQMKDLADTVHKALLADYYWPTKEAMETAVVQLHHEIEKVIPIAIDDIFPEDRIDVPTKVTKVDNSTVRMLQWAIGASSDQKEFAMCYGPFDTPAEALDINPKTYYEGGVHAHEDNFYIIAFDNEKENETVTHMWNKDFQRWDPMP